MFGIRKEVLIGVLVFINCIPYALLSYRLVRILIHESGRSENPYPGLGDPLGPEFAGKFLLLSIAASIVLILLTKSKLMIKGLLFLAIIIAHAMAYLSFIFFAFAAAQIVTGRSL